MTDHGAVFDNPSVKLSSNYENKTVSLYFLNHMCAQEKPNNDFRKPKNCNLLSRFPYLSDLIGNHGM